MSLRSSARWVSTIPSSDAASWSRGARRATERRASAAIGSLMSASLQTYLLALSALFSIVNPLGSAFIVSQVTAGRPHGERLQLPGRIALYSAIVMLVALWGGAYVLSFFGISLSALRIAGGVVVAVNAWSLLQAPETTEARKQRQAAEAEGIDAV